MSMLAQEGSPDTNNQTKLWPAPGFSGNGPEQSIAEVIAFPGAETPEKLQRLVQTLEGIIFQDTNILTTELKELGVFIEDLEGEREGLGVWIVSEGFGNRLSQHLWVDYSAEEDAVTGVLLQDELRQLADEELLAKQDFGWASGQQPADEIVRTVELINTRVDQARANRDTKIKQSARTYGRLIMDRAISTLDL